VKGGGGARINNNILSDDVIEYISFSVAAEAYIIHAKENVLPRANRNNLLTTVGRLKTLIRRAGPPYIPSEKFIADNGADWNEKRGRVIRSIEETKDQLDMDIISNLALDPDPDVFFETLMGMLKNELLNYQIFAKKQKNLLFNNLKSEVQHLKEGPAPDWEKIFRLEAQMDKMAETELRNELKKYTDFDILNEEKITPFFVKMAKGAKAESDLNVIKNIDGTEFQSDKDRENFIYEYYRNLYKKPDCIEKFLGADICNSSNVRNSKLTERESNMLNNDFTIAELDKAMGDLNTGTASGPDGLGNTVLKKLWKFIRMPFLKYANHCLYTGVLTENFRTASIKLIPKKGDTSQIKNWRPISLLNCSYKIISKAINERFKKISNRVLSRGQKGFTASKYIQE
jgi:Reverse transcriptase (RNA-dependent DNA polymerase)